MEKLYQQNAGSDAYRLFVDAIEETRARGAFPGKKRRGVGRPKHHIIDVESRVMKMWEQLRRRLDRQLIDKGVEWIPDKAFIDALGTASSEIVKLSQSIRLGRKAEQDARAGLTDEQLDAVFRTELRRIAPTLDEEDWRVLLSTGLGVDIAEAALTVYRLRVEEARAKAAKTQTTAGGVLPDGSPAANTPEKSP